MGVCYPIIAKTIAQKLPKQLARIKNSEGNNIFREKYFCRFLFLG